MNGSDAREWMGRFFAAFDREQQTLTDLDRRTGDGDFGANLRSALGRARTALDATETATPGDVFDVVSTAFLNTGGTSGPLFGMWFRNLAKATRAPTVGVADLARGFTDGTSTVQRLGGAKPGDKTMVDAMAPAAEALAAATGGIHEALAAAAAAARSGAEATAELLAKRGRASYVGEVARGVLDPGAVAVALLVEAACG
ncbi:dihydroxyacetone kinase subunit DhaL [Nonomuraea sp. NEAU-A123]|uniref:dihydroxyacetone kinase subunit DhaL n=1 Tax=Nonomuraea sp. NEAU-A123 TaxID=2839649 RepID=UPI001BE4A3ED|nr:dihydroxyacetone kinase subunit DhaL [Nonomuraea sp. NEAU-A123]MBT2233691.1 dihydroxyacetone kinase subunit L [Nonomuraea sp. NEAU-A123]